MGKIGGEVVLKQESYNYEGPQGEQTHTFQGIEPNGRGN